MNTKRWYQKPPPGTPLDRENPLLNGLQWFAPCWENGGAAIADVIGGVNLTSNCAWSSGGSALVGGAIQCTSSSNAASAALPTRLKLGAPLTFVFSLRRLGAATAYSQCFGLFTNNTNTALYGIYVTYWNSTNLLGFCAAGAASIQFLVAPTVGVDYTFALVFPTATSWIFYSASNGSVSSLSGNLSGSISPSYTSTAQIGFGAAGGAPYSSNSQYNWGGVYNRALSAAEVSAWATNPWQIFGNNARTFAIEQVAVPQASCLHVYGTSAAASWVASTNQNYLLASQTTASFGYAFRINSLGAYYTPIIFHGFTSLFQSQTSSSISSTLDDSVGGQMELYHFNFTPGVVYYLAFSFSGGIFNFYVNGELAFSGTNSNSTKTEFGTLSVGWYSNTPADIELQDLWFYSGYAVTQTDARNLRDRVKTPAQIGQSATSRTWLPLYGPQGNTPVVTDNGFQDWLGSNPFVSFSSSAAGLAKYDAPLVYVPPIQVTPYVSKSGQNLFFGFSSTYQPMYSVPGTVSIVSGSTTLTTSQPQIGTGSGQWIGFVGQQITIAGDSSAGTYKVVAGSGRNFTIAPAYGGSTNASGASATIVTQNIAQGVTNVVAAPTVKVNFGGAGSFQTVQLGGPHFTPQSGSMPWVMFPLECGTVQSIRMHNRGHGYSSPSVSAAGGGGTGLTFGTPILTGGITGFTVVTGGSGYDLSGTLGPAVNLPLPAPISITGTLTVGSRSVTGISSTAGLIPGMKIIGHAPIATTIAAVNSSTAITLAAPAAYAGSTSLTAYGRQALATAVLSGGVVVGVNVFDPGSGYSGAGATVTITAPANTVPQATGSGASVTYSISNVIDAIPVTASGAGYTSPPTITITDSTGSGAVAVPVMGGLGASDVVEYTAIDSWASTGIGPAGAVTNGSVQNCVGQSEPGFGGFLGFNLPANERVLQMGINIARTEGAGTMSQNTVNWLSRIDHTVPDTINGIEFQSANTGVYSHDPGGYPYQLSGTMASPTFLPFADASGTCVDNYDNAFPGASGIKGSYWTYIFDETQPGSTATVVGMASGRSDATITATQVSTGTSTIGVNAITSIPTSGGSGYASPPTVTIVGGNPTVAATAACWINSNGQVVWLKLLSTGSGYTLGNTPTMVFSGGGGSGAAGSVTLGSVKVGVAWQFTTEQTSQDFDLGLGITLYRPVTPPYLHSLVNECLFDPVTTAAAYPALPSRAAGTYASPTNDPYLTSATPKYPAVLRCMQFEDVGLSTACNNVIDVADLPTVNDYSWNGELVYSNSTPLPVSSNPTATRLITATSIRPYCLSNTGIAAIVATSVGSGYSGTVPVVFTSTGNGFGAVAYATVTMGAFVSVTVTAGGSGYTSGTTATISSGTGSGAVFTVNLNGTAIQSVTVVSGGSGYTSYLPVTITDAHGTGASATATVSPAGTICGPDVENLLLVSGGSGYTSTPAVSFSGGGNAAATAIVTNGVVTGFNVNFYQQDSSYTTIPTVTISGGGGTGAAATAVMNTVTINATGSGYTSPTATIGGGGSGAALTVYVGYPSGVVGGLLVTNGGSGYSGTPTVTISAPGSGVQAVATAIVTNGAVTGFTMAVMGSGYSSASPPTVQISGGGGTRATATAVVWGTNVESPNLYLNNPGTGSSTAVSSASGWNGFGGGGTAGGPYVLQPKSTFYLNPTNEPIYFQYCAEVVTSGPHNLKTGQSVTQVGGTGGTFYVTNGTTASVPSFGFYETNYFVVWVTGPTTFAFWGHCPSNTDPATFIPGNYGTIAGTYPVDFVFLITVPDPQFTPYEIQARYVGNWPGTNLWVNTTLFATDALVRFIAQKVRDNFPMGRKVYVEYHNEHFNTASDNQFLVPAVMIAMGQLGIWSNQYLTQDQAYVERMRQHQDIFVQVFNQTDINGNRNRGGEIVRVAGSFYANDTITQNEIAYANQQGIKIDAVAVADYYDASSESTSPTVAASVNVTGSGGSLPAGFYWVYYTWVDGITGIETDVGASVSGLNQTTGAEPIVTIPSFPSWGAGTANIYLTAAGGSQGTETLYLSGVTGTTATLAHSQWDNNTVAQSSAPAPPAYNLMPSTVMAAALTATQWPASLAYANANPRSRAAYLEFYRHCVAYGSTSYYNQHQQALNQYAVGSYPIPQLVAYEGGLETVVPSGVQTMQNPDPNRYWLRSALTADFCLDPAMYDAETAFYLMSQQGGVSTLALFTYGGIGNANTDDYDGHGAFTWFNFTSIEQPVGHGDGSLASNGQYVTNIFWSDTGLAPQNFDATVRTKAWLDWVDAANPYVVPGSVFVTPANGSSGFSPRGVIVVEFDEPMLRSTITGSTFTLKLGKNSISGTVAYNPITWAATFTPSSMLSAGATYTAQVTTGVQNAQGVALPNAITWTFTTGMSASASLGWFPGLSRPTPTVKVSA